MKLNGFPMKNQRGCRVLLVIFFRTESRRAMGKGPSGRMALACSFWAHVPRRNEFGGIPVLRDKHDRMVCVVDKIPIYRKRKILRLISSSNEQSANVDNCIYPVRILHNIIVSRSITDLLGVYCINL